MGTLKNQSFKPSNQDAMTSMDDKMPATGPSTGRSGGANTSPNMIGDGGAGPLSGARMGNMSRAGMGSGRIPTEGNTNSTGTKRSG